MMPSWKQFLNEGILTNYRNEKEGRKLTANDFKNSFEVILCKLITERIPFWFDCQGVGGEFSNVTKIGYLMNESINDQSFGGYILNVDDPTDEDAVKHLVRMPTSPQNASLRLRPQSGAKLRVFFLIVGSAPDSFRGCRPAFAENSPLDCFPGASAPLKGKAFGLYFFNHLEIEQYYR